MIIQQQICKRTIDEVIGRSELPILVFLMWMVFISIPITLGHLGLGWDSLNHHIYLGWTAELQRFDKDYMAAGPQAYSFPYLYWPVYKLSKLGLSGTQVGVVLATLHLIVVPPIWIVSRTLISGRDLWSVLMRCAAVALAFMTTVPLKTLESTGNDLLSAAPVLWSIALIFHALSRDHDRACNIRKINLLSGALAGLSVAFKLSNGPLVVLMPLLFLLFPGTVGTRVGRVALNSFSIAFSFLLFYSYWGIQVWHVVGNPVFPFHDELFAPLRVMTGWTP